MTSIREQPSTPPHVGLDVARLTLQVDLAGRSLALANTAAGHRSLLTEAGRVSPTNSIPAGTGQNSMVVLADQPLQHTSGRVTAVNQPATSCG